MSTINASQVQHIAKLAQIPITDNEAERLHDDFKKTLEVIDQLTELDTTNVEPTNQITGLENVCREDNVDQAHSFTQEEALQNASNTYQGYFVVPKILEK
ncbi:MAG TPA: Asp-tRNA(Asn)/Glu-tRNA(Gln) amidotransferase subunit GatC [Candidatus Woesebacteria bacterium]|nr:Asp-tRNA(Asn)/Glu-tRNA(Gln) amidotransferase subunit GatC [Candidatus Woesebacteria bacterium]